ncbi:MAG: hypothetical protein JW795_06075 [Chitinivibrionales bacterium]|nr:hypothetical protein [Chitinivibrionales bacterium]
MGTAYVEIEHTYGAAGKSVYTIIEYDESGLSFLIPFAHGYFLVDTPVKLTIVHKEVKFRRLYTGIVKHYSTACNDKGDKFYRTGVAISPHHRDCEAQTRFLRPHRLNSAAAQNRICFTLNTTTYSFPVADVARYSAAFYCEDEEVLFFSASMVLADLQVHIDSTCIFTGSATIIRTYRDNGGRNRVVVQPRRVVIRIEDVQTQHCVDSACKELSAAIARHRDVFQTVSVDFAAHICGLRYFLDEIKDSLDTSLLLSQERTATRTLETLFPLLFEIFDQKIRQIDAIVNSLERADCSRHEYKAIFQKQLLSLLLQAPINHRAFFKPCGYPGDYEIMHMNHANTFEGATPFARFLHKCSTSSPLGSMARKRTEYLTSALVDYLQKHRESDTRIFSVASGPALEMQELLKNHSDLTHRLSVTLLDQEIKALEYSMDLLLELKLKNSSTIQINFIHNTIQSYLAGATNVDTAPFDIIYSFGLFDYFDTMLAQYVIANLLTLLKKGGKLIIANISLDGNGYRTYLEFVMDWYLIYRSRADLEKLGYAFADRSTFKIDEIESGMMKFLELAI